MFGGGAKKEKKEEEDRGDVSGSAKAQREAAVAAKGDEVCFPTTRWPGSTTLNPFKTVKTN